MSLPSPTIRWPKKGLYAVTPEDRFGSALVDAITDAATNGARAVQYRNKSSDKERRQHDASALVSVCHDYGIPLIVNDDVDLALAAGADGVHLGRDDARLASARARLGPSAIIGISCYDEPERALAAAREGADYVAFGSFFPSVTKPGAVRATTELVSTVRPRIEVPIVGIGGITPENGSPLIAAGVDVLAVVSAIFSASDIGRATRRLAELFD